MFSLSATTGSRMTISSPPGFLSPSFSNRRSLRSKCGLFQTENRSSSRNRLPRKADPELYGHRGRASTNCPSRSASAARPKHAALGARPSGKRHVLLGEQWPKHIGTCDLVDLRTGCLNTGQDRNSTAPGEARELEEAVRSRAGLGPEHSLYVSVWAFLGTRGTET